MQAALHQRLDLAVARQPAGFGGGSNAPAHQAHAASLLPLAPHQQSGLGDHLIFDAMTGVFRATQAGRAGVLSEPEAIS